MTETHTEPHTKAPQPQEARRLTHEQFNKALDDLRVTPARFAAAIGVGTRIVQLWAKGTQTVPRYAAVIISLMQRFELSIEDIEEATG